MSEVHHMVCPACSRTDEHRGDCPYNDLGLGIDPPPGAVADYRAATFVRLEVGWAAADTIVNELLARHRHTRSVDGVTWRILGKDRDALIIEREIGEADAGV